MTGYRDGMKTFTPSSLAASSTPKGVTVAEHLKVPATFADSVSPKAPAVAVDVQYDRIFFRLWKFTTHRQGLLRHTINMIVRYLLRPSTMK